MPRKTKLTPELQANFMQAISVGATHRIACEYAGITGDTLYRWLRLGEAGRQPYSSFSEQVKLASGRAAIGWLAKIEKAASDGVWQAAAWKLERRYPQEYGRTVEAHEVTYPEGLPTQRHEVSADAKFVADVAAILAEHGQLGTAPPEPQ